ncbi:MAG: hypothetical protein Q9159_002917 [Coniocarpon cinnabarinum]
MSDSQTPRNTRSFTETSWHGQPSLRSITPSAVQTADAQEMLQLMRSSRGRMQGNVSFREIRSRSTEWIHSYCYVDMKSAALLWETLDNPQSTGSFDILIQNLRGVKVQSIYEDSIRNHLLQIVYQTAEGYESVLQLTPDRANQLNGWYAALLCWQVVRPSQLLSTDAQTTRSGLRPSTLKEPLQTSRASVASNEMLKKERALLLVQGSPEFSNRELPNNTTAKDVHCIIRATGELSVHALDSKRSLVTINLQQMPRSAIQPLDKSVFGLPRSIAIYPQYALTKDACSSLSPVFLSFSFTDVFELFTALLKAFAVPEIYRAPSGAITGFENAKIDFDSRPGQHIAVDDFRVERQIDVCTIKLELDPNILEHRGARHVSDEFYIEILIDEQIKLKTPYRSSTNSSLRWADDFKLTDLPSNISSCSFRLKRRYVEDSYQDVTDTASIATSNTGIYIRSMHSAFDSEVAIAEVNLGCLFAQKSCDLSLELIADHASRVGVLTTELQFEEQVIVNEDEYDGLVSLLQNYTNDLTLDIAERNYVPQDVLAKILLNIFETHGKTEHWLRHLIREEVYGRRKAAKNPRHSFDGRASGGVGGTTSVASSQNEAAQLSDEAALLFRANSLLTRALDTYMRRLGQPYLENVLRVKLQDIADAEEQCEVDPSKLEDDEDIHANWKRLMTNTKAVWSWIRNTIPQCPLELRRILRTIRDCAVDRFGSLRLGKEYTSVSSFLFLRFFCAAILSPRVFGLLKAEPGPRAARTFMLIAKSLIGFANMSLFGPKEFWMNPMNSFCKSNRDDFQRFINQICDVDLETRNDQVTDETQTRDTLNSDQHVLDQSDRSLQKREEVESPELRVGQRSSRSDTSREARGLRNSPSSSTRSPEIMVSRQKKVSGDGEVPTLLDTTESAACIESFSAEDTKSASSSIKSFDLYPDATNEQTSPVNPTSSQGPDRSGVDSRMSIASHSTAIWVGPEHTQSSSVVKTGNVTPDSRVSMSSNLSASDITSTFANLEVGDINRIDNLKSVLGRGDQLETDSTSSSSAEDALPPSILRPRHGEAASSAQLDRRELSNQSSSQTLSTYQSTAPSSRPLNGKSSIDQRLAASPHSVLDCLPDHHRGGLLTLPGLVDYGHSLALLADLWLKNFESRLQQARMAPASEQDQYVNTPMFMTREFGDSKNPLGQFHRLSQQARDKAKRHQDWTRTALFDGPYAEDDEGGGITAPNISVKWVTIAEAMETSPHLYWIVRDDGRSSRGSRTTSAYSRTMSFDKYAPSSLSSPSRESVDTMRSVSTMASAAPFPPPISRDPRERQRSSNFKKPGHISIGAPPKSSTAEAPAGGKKRFGFFSGSNASGSLQSSATSTTGRSATSQDSGGSSPSERSGKDSKGPSKSSKKERRKSPPRTQEQTAMRKLGWS